MVLTPERWQHIARIYQLAVDQDPSTRDTFLSEACAGDETLRSEVESLLRQVAVKVLPSSGRKQEAKKLILQLEDTYKDRYFCPYEIGHVYVTLGEMDTAYKLTPLAQ